METINDANVNKNCILKSEIKDAIKNNIVLDIILPIIASLLHYFPIGSIKQNTKTKRMYQPEPQVVLQ